jgi:hypothetical protein
MGIRKAGSLCLSRGLVTEAAPRKGIRPIPEPQSGRDSFRENLHQYQPSDPNSLFVHGSAIYQSVLQTQGERNFVIFKNEKKLKAIKKKREEDPSNVIRLH